MTDKDKNSAPEENEKPNGLDLLRAPFPEHAISKLPKPTKKQTDEVRSDFKKGIRCQVCGGWHHPNVVHLDYVGHAALTDRLLDCDPRWNWEPLAFTDKGTPAQDENGGMWIKLTVCDVTRYGYGHPDGKKGGDAIKEVIGDALRNAAMRFGAALDLWHKGNLHLDPDPEIEAKKEEQAEIEWFKAKLPEMTSAEEINGVLGRSKKAGRDVAKLVVDRAKALGLDFDPDARRYIELAAPESDEPDPHYMGGDEIPYQNEGQTT